jgi:hypothetical protein
MHSSWTHTDAGSLQFPGSTFPDESRGKRRALRVLSCCRVLFLLFGVLFCYVMICDGSMLLLNLMIPYDSLKWFLSSAHQSWMYWRSSSGLVFSPSQPLSAAQPGHSGTASRVAAGNHACTVPKLFFSSQGWLRMGSS